MPTSTLVLRHTLIVKGCMSYCAISSKNYVVMVDDVIIEAKTYEELLKKPVYFKKTLGKKLYL